MAVRPGVLGWAAIAGFVVVYDAWAIATKHQTLSSACWDLQQTSAGRAAALGAWLTLGFHFFVEPELRERTLKPVRPENFPPVGPPT